MANIIVRVVCVFGMLLCSCGASVRIDPSATKMTMVDLTTSVGLATVDPTTSVSLTTLDPTTIVVRTTVDSTTSVNLAKIDPTMSVGLTTIDQTTSVDLAKIEPTTSVGLTTVDSTTSVDLAKIEPTMSVGLATSHTIVNPKIIEPTPKYETKSTADSVVQPNMKTVSTTEATLPNVIHFSSTLALLKTTLYTIKPSTSEQISIQSLPISSTGPTYVSLSMKTSASVSPSNTLQSTYSSLTTTGLSEKTTKTTSKLSIIPSTAPTESSVNDSGSASGAAIGGILIGVLLCVVIMAAIVYIARRQSLRRSDSLSSTSMATGRRRQSFTPDPNQGIDYDAVDRNEMNLTTFK